MEALWLLLGAALGAAAGYLLGASRAARRGLEEAARLRARESELSATLAAERRGAAEKLSLVEESQGRLKEAFRALSAEALHESNRSFLDLARAALERLQVEAQGDLFKRETAVRELVQPLGDALQRVTQQMDELERQRQQAYGTITEQVRSLQAETANLVKALRQPSVRGRWGEIQLRRAVELAGMLPHCDFLEQPTVQGDERRLRPDLVVRLPGGKHVVVDAKAPLQAYLEAVDAPDEGTRKAKMAEHARQLRAHLTALSHKSYWVELQPAPEFVVLFLPGESFFSAALEQDPALIEEGVRQRVILATPTTLIALLRSVAYGWRQEQLAENAQRICEEGRQLYERLRALAGHFERMREGLAKAVEAYNGAVGSLESRVLVSARRLKELGGGLDRDVPAPAPVDAAPRRLVTGEDAPAP